MTIVERLQKKAEQYRMEADKYRARECFQLAEICDAKAVGFQLAIREVRRRGMSFSYAVIRHDANGWHVSVNDFATTHEATAKTLDEAMKQTKRLIEQTQEATCQK